MKFKRKYIKNNQISIKMQKNLYINETSVNILPANWAREADQSIRLEATWKSPDETPEISVKNKNHRSKFHKNR